VGRTEEGGLKMATKLTLTSGLAAKSVRAQFQALRLRAREELVQIPEVDAVYFAFEEGEPIFLVYLADERFNRELRQRIYDVGHRLEDEFPDLYFRFECLSRRPQRLVPVGSEELFDRAAD
jgi:hypothetical protein